MIENEDKFRDWLDDKIFDYRNKEYDFDTNDKDIIDFGYYINKNYPLCIKSANVIIIKGEPIKLNLNEYISNGYILYLRGIDNKKYKFILDSDTRRTFCKYLDNFRLPEMGCNNVITNISIDKVYGRIKYTFKFKSIIPEEQNMSELDNLIKLIKTKIGYTEEVKEVNCRIITSVTLSIGGSKQYFVDIYLDNSQYCRTISFENKDMIRAISVFLRTESYIGQSEEKYLKEIRRV